MKKYFLIFALLFPLMCHSKQVILLLDNQPVYESDDINSPVPIASLTKMVTALVAIKYDMNEVIEITNDDIDTLKHTRSKIKVGMSFTRDQLIHVMLIASENRAAYALSRAHPGGRAGFLKEMKEVAIALGATNANFVDSAGLSPGNVASAADILKIGREFALNQQLSQISVTKTYLLGKLKYNSTNSLVRSNKEVTTQKTGFTNEAKQCLFIIYNKMIIVILGANNKYTELAIVSRKK